MKIGLLVFGLCWLLGGAAPVLADALDDAYTEAIADARIISAGETKATILTLAATNTTLDWRVVNGETYTLMVNFTKYPGSFTGRIGDTLMLVWGKTWVATAREVRQFIMGQDIPTSQRKTRMCQLLGLPATGNNQSLAFMWVRPRDMFRPAYDSSVLHGMIRDTFPAGTDTAYIAWFTDNESTSYNSVQPFPWTRLGYTYDWGTTAFPHIGLSEFVVIDSAVVWIEAVAPIASYLVANDPAAAVAYPSPYIPNDGDPATGMPYDGSYGSGIIFEPIPHNAIISVYDLQGRLLKTLRPGAVSRCQWDGRNEDGEELASGCYLFGIASAGGSRRGKFLVVR